MILNKNAAWQSLSFDMFPIWGVFVCLCFCICQCWCKNETNCVLNPSHADCCPGIDPDSNLTEAALVSKLTNPCRYDKLVIPHPKADEPLPVTAQIHMHHLESGANFQFTAFMSVQYKYKDCRLKYNNTGKKLPDLIVGEEDLKSRIWIPHLFIQNEKDSMIMGVEKKDVFITISPEGDVVYSYRMTATFYCWMNLKKFPFDSQECNLKLTSWSYNSSKLVLLWDNPGFMVAKDMYLTEFVLDSYKSYTAVTSGVFTTGQLVGDFSQLIIQFKLYREVGYYLLDYYIPSILLVCTSWVTFWLQADAGPPRAVLSASPIVAFVTLNVGLASSLPKVSSVKASDIWFFAISCFLFLALAEFAFVNVIWRRKKKVELKKNNSMHILKGAMAPKAARQHLRKVESTQSFSNFSWDNVSCGSYNYNPDTEVATVKIGIASDDESSYGMPASPPQAPPTWTTMTPQEVAIWIDRKSRIVFPLAFVIFNIFYWVFVWIP